MATMFGHYSRFLASAGAQTTNNTCTLVQLTEVVPYRVACTLVQLTEVVPYRVAASTGLDTNGNLLTDGDNRPKPATPAQPQASASGGKRRKRGRKSEL